MARTAMRGSASSLGLFLPARQRFLDSIADELRPPVGSDQSVNTLQCFW